MVDLHNYTLPRMCGSTLGLDLQDGGIMVEDGQNNFVHVLPQTQVNLLLLFQSVDQLRDTERKKRFSVVLADITASTHTLNSRLTSSLEALSISAARH